MKKRILSLLLCIAMVIAMLPIINMTANAADPDHTFSIAEEYYYPQSASDPETIPFSDFQEGLGDWDSGYNSPVTKNFTAMFVVLKVDVELPAYTKVKVDCRPIASASSPIFKLFGDFTRIKILYLLFDGELCVCDIAQKLNMNQSAISHQLKSLKLNKLVKSRRYGNIWWQTKWRSNRWRKRPPYCNGVFGCSSLR